MSNQFYDRMRFLAQIVVPALGALYFGCDKIWNLSASETVLGAIVVLDLFLGLILLLSSALYDSSDARYSGAIVVGEQLEDGMQNFRMELPLDAKHVINQKELVLKVKKP